jgi:hypothetical protein
MRPLGEQRTVRPPRKGDVFLPRRRAPLPTPGVVIALAGGEILLLAMALAWPAAVPLPAVVMPLALVCVGLVVHAWQARRVGYVFIAGLFGNLVATLLVHCLNRYLPWEKWLVLLIQANAVAFGVAALVALAARRRLFGAYGAATVLRLQIGLGLLANSILAASAVGVLLLRPAALPDFVARVGGVAGWLALGLAAVAGVWYARVWEPGRLLSVVTSNLLAAGVLTACMSAAWDQGRWLAYHILTAAWAALAVGVLGYGTRTDRDPPGRPALGWVVLLGGLVLALGLRGVIDDVLAPGSSAAAVLFVSCLAADLAVMRRNESWVFAAALCLNLAVSMLLGAFSEAGLRHGGWVHLVQANTITTAAAGLVWLAVGRRLYPEDVPGSTTPLLATLVFLVLIGNLALLIPAAVLLVWAPGEPSVVVTHAGGPAGWAALLLGVIAAGWYGERSRTPGTLHELCALGLALGILLACSIAAFTDNFWLAYHVLMGLLAALGLAVLAIGWRQGRRATGAMPTAAVQGWVGVLDVLLAALALRVLSYDPLGPWPPAAGLLLGALLAGALVLWTGRQSFVWVGGLLLVGVVVAFGADVHFSPDWVALNLLGQALAATVCFAAGAVVRRYRPGHLPRGDALPFTHVATLLSLLGVILLGAMGKAGMLTDLRVPPPGPLGWAALGSVVLALVAALWDPDAVFPLAGLYAAAFAAVGFTLSALPPAWPGPDVPALAAFVTLATVLWKMARPWERLAAWLGIPRRLGGWPRAWFAPTQALLGSAAVFLSVWLCLWHAGTSERFAGPVALGLLLPAALLAAGPSRPRAQDAVLILIALLAVDLAWVGLDSAMVQRVGLVLAGAAVLALLYAVVLPRLCATASGWRSSGRRVGALVAVLAAGGGLWALLEK